MKMTLKQRARPDAVNRAHRRYVGTWAKFALRRRRHQAKMPVVEVVCPDGAGEGMMIDVNLGDAGVVQVEVPAGVGPGMPFNIEIADPPPAEGDGSTMETKFEGVGNVDYEKEDVDAEVLAALNGESGVTYSGYNKNVGGNRHNEWIKSLQPGMPGLVLRSDGSLSYGTVISADDTIITWDIGGVEKTTDDNGCAPRRPRARALRPPPRAAPTLTSPHPCAAGFEPIA